MNRWNVLLVLCLSLLAWNPNSLVQARRRSASHSQVTTSSFGKEQKSGWLGKGHKNVSRRRRTVFQQDHRQPQVQDLPTPLARFTETAMFNAALAAGYNPHVFSSLMPFSQKDKHI